MTFKEPLGTLISGIVGVGELIWQKQYLSFQGALIAGCVHLDIHDTLLPSGPWKLKRKSKDSKCKLLKPGLSKGGVGLHRSYFILLDLMIYTQLLISSFILSHRFCFSVFLSSRGIQNKELWGLMVCKVHNKNRYLRKRGDQEPNFMKLKQEVTYHMQWYFRESFFGIQPPENNELFTRCPFTTAKTTQYCIDTFLECRMFTCKTAHNFCFLLIQAFKLFRDTHSLKKISRESVWYALNSVYFISF